MQTIDDLRRLLRVRAPANASRSAQVRVARARDSADANTNPQASIGDRDVPGVELLPHLRLIETVLPLREDDAPAELLCAGFDRRDALRTRDLICFDTETTGLAGGAGTRAFMIGAAQWRDDGLRVRQWFITALSAERDMLAAFADAISPDAVLVSYNGKSYDAPLLAARYRLARLCDPLAGRAHVDLLYPVRRRYRGRWENCRLTTIERRALGIVREDDLPGSEAPAAWLRYLRGGSARPLRRVAEHNRQDLVSLSALLLHLSATGDEPPVQR